VTEDEEKKLFAIELLKNPSESFKCAIRVFGADTGKALKVHNMWPIDVTVLQYQAEYIKEHGHDKTLPTKEVFARTVYDIANEKGNDLEVRLKYFKLYGDIRGYIEKPGAINNITNNSQINNKVMIVKDHGSDDNWAKNLATQQKKLISDNV